MDIAKVLKAIAQVETEGGRNNYPRVEVSYIPKGERFTVQGHILEGTGRNVNAVVIPRWNQYGLMSACSFGRYQMLYHTAADMGFKASPWHLWDDQEAYNWATKRVEKILALGAQTIEQVADAWNSGTFKDGFVPHEYIAKVVAAYEGDK